MFTQNSDSFKTKMLGDDWLSLQAVKLSEGHNSFHADYIKFQVRRLQHHASIALWAGNNENELALVGNWYGTDNNYTNYVDDYLKLYIDTIKEVIDQEDISRPFVVSISVNYFKVDQKLIKFPSHQAHQMD